MKEIEYLENEIEIIKKKLNNLIEKSLCYRNSFSTEILLLSQKLDGIIVLYTIKKFNIDKLN